MVILKVLQYLVSANEKWRWFASTRHRSGLGQVRRLWSTSCIHFQTYRVSNRKLITLFALFKQSMPWVRGRRRVRFFVGGTASPGTHIESPLAMVDCFLYLQKCVLYVAEIAVTITAFFCHRIHWLFQANDFLFVHSIVVFVCVYFVFVWVQTDCMFHV